MEEASRDKGSGPMEVSCQLPLMFHKRCVEEVPGLNRLNPTLPHVFPTEGLPQYYKHCILEAYPGKHHEKTSWKYLEIMFSLYISSNFTAYYSFNCGYCGGCSNIFVLIDSWVQLLSRLPSGRNL